MSQKCGVKKFDSKAILWQYQQNLTLRHLYIDTQCFSSNNVHRVITNRLVHRFENDAFTSRFNFPTVACTEPAAYIQ